jgi:hypothetical protein
MYKDTLSKFIAMTLVVVALFSFKPLFFFNGDGTIRTYGFGRDASGRKNTLFTISTLITVLVIFLFAGN